MRRLVQRRFGEETAARFTDQVEPIDNTDHLAEIGEWIIDCQDGDELLTRVRDARFG